MNRKAVGFQGPREAAHDIGLGVSLSFQESLGRSLWRSPESGPAVVAAVPAAGAQRGAFLIAIWLSHGSRTPRPSTCTVPACTAATPPCAVITNSHWLSGDQASQIRRAHFSTPDTQ